MTADNSVVLAIDPGPETSTYLIWDGKEILEKDTVPNLALMELLDFNNYSYKFQTGSINYKTIEMVESRGMPVSKATIETVYWIGVFGKTIGIGWFSRLTPSQIRLHLCGTKQAKASNVKTALVDRVDPMRKFGNYAKGKKKNPGPFFGVSDHDWAALALAVTYWEIVQG